MKSRVEITPEPIFNILNIGQLDVDALKRDYNWSVIKCTDWDARDKIARELRPTEGILAIRTEDYDGKKIFVMSKFTTDELKLHLEEEFGREKLRELGTVFEMKDYEMTNPRIVQLLLNSMSKKSVFMETNAEGQFFMILRKEYTKDVPKPFYGQLLVMKIEAAEPPECMKAFGSVLIKFSLKTLNNTLREQLAFDPKKWKNATYRLDEWGIHTGMPPSEGDMFVYKAVYREKAHKDLLNWASSKDEKKLNESRSVKVYEVIERLKNRYGMYLGDVSFASCKGEIFKDNNISIYKDRLEGHFKDREVRIYNCTGPENKDAVDKFVKYVEGAYQFKVKRADGPCIGGYNVPIIFNEDYYKDKDATDPHKQPTVGITQFAVIDTIRDIVEDYEEKIPKYKASLEKYEEDKKKWCADKANKGKKYAKNPPAQVTIPQAEVILEQLFIKEDVVNDVISFYHWAEQGYTGDWTFAIPISHTEKRKRFLDGFACMTVDKSGKIISKGFFNPADPMGPSTLTRLDWNKISYAVIDPSGDVNLVTQTEALTITDGLSIKRMIEDNKRRLAEYEERTKDWTDEQKEADKRNKPQRAGGVSTQETRMKYMGGCVGVGYHKLSSNRWIYYVGALDNPNQAITNASVVYLIESVDGSRIFFDELFPMMTVPFVRHNQNSVTPFPIKYLKEWYKMENPNWKG